MAEKKENVHEGHRERMRQKYLAVGGDAMPTHELLEMVLFYAIPRSNTNPVAHELLEHFNSLEHVVNTKPGQIARTEGIGEQSAILLSLIGDILRRIALESTAPPKKYTSMKDMVGYLHRLFIGLSQECIYMMMFDNGMRLIDTVELARGEVNHVLLDQGRLMKEVIMHNASAVLLAHNHPDGDTCPSLDDRLITDRVRYLLSSTNITFIDHLIFASTGYTSILHPPEKEPIEIEDNFYETYYKAHSGLDESTAEE